MPNCHSEWYAFFGYSEISHILSVYACPTDWLTEFPCLYHHHHHHHDAKCSAVASRHCDLSPKWAIFCQLQRVSHWYSCVPADLMDPSDGRSTTSAFPIRRWPGFAASPKYLVCWNVLCESGNMTKQSESLLANDGRGCQETVSACISSQKLLVSLLTASATMEHQDQATFYTFPLSSFLTLYQNAGNILYLML